MAPSIMTEAPDSPEFQGVKRSSSTFSSGDDNKKARGRPRVEPQDETAADRRRTQIRLAQRTYRQRKESTITTLQTKVSQLETIIHEMHSSVQGLKQDALTSQIGEFNPAFSRKFADATKKLEMLARDAKVDKVSRAQSDEWLSDQAEDFKSPKRARTGKSSSKSSSSSQAQVAVVKERTPTIVSEEQRGVPSVWGYETIYAGAATRESREDNDINNALNGYPQTTQQSSYDNISPQLMGFTDQSSGLLTPYNGFDFTGPLIPDMQLPLPRSIAHEETTFGRRLHRTILEAAVRLLNDPFAEPGKLEQKFGHVMRYASQSDIATRLAARLRRTKHEPLESNFNYPPITYYGPYSRQEWKIPAEYHAQIDFLSHEDNTGDGAWYAPDDVQTYLERRGIHINPSDSIVECDIDMILPAKQGGWYSPTGSVNGDNNHYGTPTSQDSSNVDPIASTNGATSMPYMLQNATLEAYTSYIPSPTGTPTDGAKTQQLERVHRRITINVVQLIAELIKAAVCLGRSPGFRRRDVEKALRNSLTAVSAS